MARLQFENKISMEWIYLVKILRTVFCFYLQSCAYKEFSKTINKLKILKLNTKPRTGPFIIDKGRNFSYIIFGPAGNWADQILCDTGAPVLDSL